MVPASRPETGAPRPPRLPLIAKNASGAALPTLAENIFRVKIKPK